MAEAAAPFDWKHPNYSGMLRDRQRKLARIRRNPAMLPALRELYKRSPVQWINDWVVTYDPRNAERNIPTMTPFALMPFQEEWIDFVLKNWRTQQYGLTEKSREQGLSWLCVAFAVWICTHYRGVRVGFGSYKAELVDELGNAGGLFEKMRILLRNLPREFRGGWTEENSKRYQIDFPDTGSGCVGQVGDNCGRGDRTSLYFLDEAAHLERPLLIDAALSATTNCRQDISSVFGFANPFAQKVHEGKLPVFRASYLDDLRKDEAWKQRMIDQVGDTIFGQEFGADYMAGVTGQCIPGRWLQSCVDLHKRLEIPATGALRAGLDVAAPGGQDLMALAIRKGVVLQHLSAWKPGDGKDTAARAIREMAKSSCEHIAFDAIGVGERMGEFLKDAKPDDQPVRIYPFKASETPENPERKFPGTKSKNEEMLKNKKSQIWWDMRRRVENSYRLSQGDTTVDTDEIFSIGSDTVENVNELIAQLSQATFSVNSAGKIEIDKSPDGCRSPDRAEAVLIAFRPEKAVMHITSDALAAFARALPGSMNYAAGNPYGWNYWTPTQTGKPFAAGSDR